MRFVAIALIIVSVGLACAGQMKASRPAQSGPVAPANAVPNGVWGGEHIRMDVTDSGADIEFDCARGSISQRLVLDAQGRFKLQGTYKAETPAVVRKNCMRQRFAPATVVNPRIIDRRPSEQEPNPFSSSQ